MYSLTFHVRVTTPTVWTKWNGLVAGVSILSLARGVYADMRSACGGSGGIPLGSAVAIATQPVHRLQIRPIVHN